MPVEVVKQISYLTLCLAAALGGIGFWVGNIAGSEQASARAATRQAAIATAVFCETHVDHALCDSVAP